MAFILHLFVCMWLYEPLRHSPICLSVCSYVYLPVCLSVRSSVCPSVRPSLSISLSLSLYLLVSLSLSLSLCMTVRRWINQPVRLAAILRLYNTVSVHYPRFGFVPSSRCQTVCRLIKESSFRDGTISSAESDVESFSFHLLITKRMTGSETSCPPLPRYQMASPRSAPLLCTSLTLLRLC